MISLDQDRKFVAVRLISKNNEGKLVVITNTFRSGLNFIEVVKHLNERFDLSLIQKVTLFDSKEEMDT